MADEVGSKSINDGTTVPKSRGHWDSTYHSMVSTVNSRQSLVILPHRKVRTSEIRSWQSVYLSGLHSFVSVQVWRCVHNDIAAPARCPVENWCLSIVFTVALIYISDGISMLRSAMSKSYTAESFSISMARTNVRSPNRLCWYYPIKITAPRRRHRYLDGIRSHFSFRLQRYHRTEIAIPVRCSVERRHVSMVGTDIFACSIDIITLPRSPSRRDMRLKESTSQW
jgi:hypothetical protein